MADKINEMLAQATTREEIDLLSDEADKAWQHIQGVRDKGLAEITKREETVTKERKH